MEWKQSIVIQRNSTVHPEQEVHHQGELNHHIRRKFFSQIFVPFPAISKAIDVEFRRSYEFTTLAHMSFQNSDRVMQRKP